MLEYFNFRIIWEYMPLFMDGLYQTVWISLVGIIGSLIVGMIACSCRISGIRILSAPAVVFIEVIRSTPLLAQLYFLYFGLPSLGIQVSELTTGIVALSVNSGAYVAEILRAGIKGIPGGQVEAAMGQGFNVYQRFFYILLPQALANTLPTMLGQAIVLVKDSAVLSLISVMELTRAGQILNSERFMPSEAFLTVAALYLLVYYVLKGLSKFYQMRMMRFRSA
ncbi:MULTISPECIES: amino acid ABC transporter permease [unclassified Pseudodesulfovibrio]|uniref:amino acid ABC transporter permease n=1 Tax=unclassified Pseudodesulfovibrio TaxID=2661612 RepID=UPI000FEB5E94|nr:MULTISPECIES: amino acid ABC transporter permease [unclassified Pseudodesulfovibrio]MCJ2164465.1 amino acid ABC transporter permease [Pseudodesulfovibrio sp. S3-i]RWU04667.1 amino acid ABC transporter permease [Pseudodesulfovibrio sp. S3]